MLKFLRRLAPSIVVSWAFAATCAAFVGWLVSEILPSAFSMPSNWVAVVLALAIFLYSGSVLHILLKSGDRSLSKPELLQYRETPAAPLGLFQFSECEWLSYNSAYAIFILENGDFETPLCIARMLVIQDDRKVQLLVTDRTDESGDVWIQLLKNSTDYKGRILIKPGYPLGL